MHSSPATSSSSPVDVLILGAGPAGLSCAAGVARLLHSGIVFSSNVFRNRKSKHMHVVPGGWDHRDPADFRAASRKDILSRYNTVSFEDVAIERLEKTAREDGSSLFKAVDEHGEEWWGRKVVIATGVKDLMPDVEGFEQCWVSGIFHCLFCHGYEEHGSESAGVLAIDDCASVGLAMHLARMANRLSRKVTIYTNGNKVLAGEINALLLQHNPKVKSKLDISVTDKKILRLVKGADRAQVDLVFEDEQSRKESFMVHKPKTQVNGNWVEQLGLETTEAGDFRVNAPFNEASVPGVFVAGDCGTVIKSVVPAASMGLAAAAGLIAQLGEED